MRIVILGNSGSGKSTLARKLGADLGLPVHHMDRLHWKPRWQPSTDEELAEKVNTVIAADAWVIDGNYSRLLPQRLDRAHAAIVLDIPVWLSLVRVGKRWLTYMGRTRPDMGEGCREKWTFDAEFFKWIVTWPQRRPRTFERLAQHPHLAVKVLPARYDYAELLRWLREVNREADAAASPPLPSGQELTAAR
jgi:adenylate kinase family enzyme